MNALHARQNPLLQSAVFHLKQQRGANPETAVFVAVDGLEVGIVGTRQGDDTHLCAGQAHHSGLRPNPEVLFPIFEEVQHRVAGQCGRRSGLDQLAAVKREDALADGANPKHSIGCLPQHPNRTGDSVHSLEMVLPRQHSVQP